MRFTILFILLSVLQIRAEVKSQETLFNLKMDDVSLIEVLKAVESQGNYTCLYSYSEVADVLHLSIDVKNASVQDVLKQVLKGTNLQFKIVDQTIVIQNVKSKSTKTEQKKIKGRVLDKERLPLPGVTVLIKGTLVGCATDTAGRFTLVLPENKDLTLEFRFVGMEPKEVKLKDITDQNILEGKTDLLVVLMEQAESLDDVVVTSIRSFISDYGK